MELKAAVFFEVKSLCSRRCDGAKQNTEGNDSDQ